MRFLFIVAFALSCTFLDAQLIIKDSSDFVIEYQTMGGLYLNSCSNVTIRNCNFSHDVGSVVQFSGCDNIILDSCDLDGLGDACSGINVSGCSFIVISNCDIYNIADDGVEMGNSNHISFIGNKIHNLLGKGTDGTIHGPCYNGHSDGFEIFMSSDVLLDGNLLYDIESTSCLLLGNWGGTVKNLTLQNNIFYSPHTGFTLYIHYADGVNLYNNVFWRSVYGGLALGPDVKNLKAYNNIMQSINLTHAGISHDPANHDFDYNIIAVKNQGMPLMEHDIFVEDPGFSGIPPINDQTTFTEVTADMFSLMPFSPAIDAAFVDENTPVSDFFDSARVDYPDVDNKGVGLESFYDMGAIEFNGPAGQMVLMPVASPAPGEYDEAVSVELSSPTEGALIYFTLDGTPPTESSALYEKQIDIMSNTTVQARAFKDGLHDSPILWAEYTFNVDLVAPYVKGVIVADENTIRIIFNEPLEEASATDPGNYSIEGITISEANLDQNLSTVILTVSGLESDKEYSLVVSGINDRADPPLTIVTDTIEFVYSLAIFDDFEEGGRLNWSPKTPSRWSLVEDDGRGTYHLNTTDYSQSGDLPGEYSLLEDFEFQDFVLEITARQPEMNTGNAFADYGFIFGYSDPTNFYYFLANKDAGSNELFRVTNGTRYSLLNLGESIIPDDDYHTISFEVVDGYFYFETDDNDWEIEEDFPAGKVGLCSYNDEVYFDEFRITPIIDDPSSVNNKASINNSFNLHIYPNPASQYIDLVMENLSGRDIHVDIFNIQGRKVYEDNYTNIPDRSTIRITDISDLVEGMYIITVRTADHIFSKKLMVKLKNLK